MDTQLIPEREGVIKLLKSEFGVDCEQTGSDFSKAMGRLISKNLSQEDKDDCILLVNGVEKILEKQSQYSNISVEIIVTMSQITGHSPKKIIGAISRNTAKLKVPALSWVNKNLRVADTVANHPKLSNIGSIEKIDTIRRLDEDRLESIAESGTLVDIEGLPLTVNETPAPQLRKAVNDIIKVEKEQTQSDDHSEIDLKPVSRIVQQIEILTRRALTLIPEEHAQFDILSKQLESIMAEVQTFKNQIDSEEAELMGVEGQPDSTGEMTNN